MPKHPQAIAPDRQRRFDRAFHALSALCPGRARRVSDFKFVPSTRVDPFDVERARWLLLAMALARGTAGGAAMSAILRKGYTVTSEHGRWRHPGAVLPLDTPDLLHLGDVLPSRTCLGSAWSKWRLQLIPDCCPSAAGALHTKRFASELSCRQRVTISVTVIEPRSEQQVRRGRTSLS